MTADTVSADQRGGRRPLSFTQVFKSAFGLGFLALAVFEVGVPALGFVASDIAGTVVAGLGTVAGAILAVRR